MNKKDLKKFDCISCGENTYFLKEYYMLKEDVWLQVNPKDRGMMCIGCVENKLGRKLNHKDFSDCLLNKDLFFKSERLLNRLTGKYLIIR